MRLNCPTFDVSQHGIYQYSRNSSQIITSVSLHVHVLYQCLIKGELACQTFVVLQKKTWAGNRATVQYS